MSTTSVTVRINDDLLKKLKARADSEHRTLSNMINSILLDSFQQTISEKKEVSMNE